jgi:hypothetical protein
MFERRCGVRVDCTRQWASLSEIAFVTEVRPGDEMICGIVTVMKFYVITEKLASDWMIAEHVMH